MTKLSILNRTIFPFFILAFSLSCSSKYDALKERLDGYNQVMKWGVYTAAANFIEDEHRQEVMKQILTLMKGRKIVDFGIVDVSFNDETQDATAIIQYSYIDERTQGFKAYNEMQLWKKLRMKWYLSRIIASEKKNATHLD